MGSSSLGGEADKRKCGGQNFKNFVLGLINLPPLFPLTAKEWVQNFSPPNFQLSGFGRRWLKADLWE
jgi:hypothetical protein